MEKDPIAFRENFHMNPNEFYSLLSMIEPNMLARRETRSDAIPVKMKLATNFQVVKHVNWFSAATVAVAGSGVWATFFARCSIAFAIVVLNADIASINGSGSGSRSRFFAAY